jgi:hypothetical protein
MAAFLVRALDLPPAGEDYFGDDETSTFEASINALAASGITFGCRQDYFCPKQTVTREQMASFLVRAFSLPPTQEDYFTDDSSSSHQASINALAASGITAGCGATTFCPKAAVTRGQMLTFLHRAMDR